MQVRIGDKLKNRDGDVVQVLLVQGNELLIRFEKKREGGSHEVLDLSVYENEWTLV